MDVQAWAASVHEDDDENPSGFGLQSWNGDAQEWPAFSDLAQAQLLDSHTRARTEFIEQQLVPLITKGSFNNI